MKKILFFGFALCMGLSSFSQKSTQVQIKPMKIIDGTDRAVEIQGVIGHKPYGTTSGAKAVTINPFGSSLNMYTAIISDAVCLSVVPATNTIGFTHREGGPYSNPTSSNQSLYLKYTSDDGASWDSLHIPGNATHMFRYPSGALYNPSGNTTPGNILAVYTGPSTNGSGFDTCYRGIAKLDGSSTKTNFFEYGPANTYLNHMNSSNSICDDKYVHVYSTHYSGNSTSNAFDKWTVLNGQLDDVNATMTWSSPVDIIPGAATFAGGGFYSSGMAWSQDGSVGYFYAIAKDSSNVGNRAPQPVIWKSTDKGVTWVGPTYFDFSTIPTLKDYVWPLKSDTSTFEPFFAGGDNSSGSVVDKDGNLHIFAVVVGLSTPWTPDSSGYIYLYEPLHLVDVYTTSTGWDAKFITDLATDRVYYSSSHADPAALASSGSTPVGWDHRIQASRTLDGNNLFCAWADQPDSTILDANFYSVSLPDLFAWGYDVTTSNYTPVKSITSGTSMEYGAFFHYFGDRVIHNGSDFVLPLTATVPSGTADDPPTHYFLGGVKMAEADFTSNIQENQVSLNSFNVSQNYPNPFNSSTNVNVSIKTATQLSLAIFDLLGKKVMEINKGNVRSGEYTFVINANNLKSGIYFYTVQAGSERITKKMIVE